MYRARIQSSPSESKAYGFVNHTTLLSSDFQLGCAEDGTVIPSPFLYHPGSSTMLNACLLDRLCQWTKASWKVDTICCLPQYPHCSGFITA